MGFDKRWYGPRSDRPQDGPTELSWGRGLVPPGLRHAPPSEGGKYNGRSPDMTKRGRPSQRSDPPPGYPGDVIAY